MRRGAALAAAVVAAWALAACGSQAQEARKTAFSKGRAQADASQLLRESRAAAYAARSVRVSGSIKSSRGPITVDVEIVANRGGTGHVVLNGHPLELTVVDGHTYLRAGARLYGEAGAGHAARLANRWIEVPAGSPSATHLAALTSLENLLGAALSPHGHLYTDGEATVSGRPAIRLRDSATGTALLVEAADPHLPVSLEGPAGQAGVIELSDWNVPVRLAAPAGARTAAKLGSTG